MNVAQLCPTLCDPMDCIVHGILQDRILEWVAFPFSGDLPDPGIEPGSPALQVDSLTTGLSGKIYVYMCVYVWICMNMYICMYISYQLDISLSMVC